MASKRARCIAGDQCIVSIICWCGQLLYMATIAASIILPDMLGRGLCHWCSGYSLGKGSKREEVEPPPPHCALKNFVKMKTVQRIAVTVGLCPAVQSLQRLSFFYPREGLGLWGSHSPASSPATTKAIYTKCVQGQGNRCSDTSAKFAKTPKRGSTLGHPKECPVIGT